MDGGLLQTDKHRGEASAALDVWGWGTARLGGAIQPQLGSGLQMWIEQSPRMAAETGAGKRVQGHHLVPDPPPEPINWLPDLIGLTLCTHLVVSIHLSHITSCHRTTRNRVTGRGGWGGPVTASQADPSPSKCPHRTSKMRSAEQPEETARRAQRS